MSTALDPATTAAKQSDVRRGKAGKPEEDQPLDPAFPYRVIQFDPTVFGRVAESAEATV
jgi:hypothetical protein